MKVIENTADRLVIEDRPWLLWLFLPPMGLGAVFSAITGQLDSWGETLLVLFLGFGVLWVAWKFAPFQRFVFDRPAARFSHQVTRLTGSQTWTRALSEVERAKEGAQWVDGSRMERVVLAMSDGPYPMEAGFTGLSRRGVIEEINAWLTADDGNSPA